jgi:predicted nucleic acid-binding Zn ribbon protein
MNIGDEVLIDGQTRGIIRFIEGGKYGVWKHGSAVTHYYDAARLKRIEADPPKLTRVEGFQVGDMVGLKHYPKMVRRIIEFSDDGSQAGLQIGHTVDGKPILKWRDLSMLVRIDAADPSDANNRDTAGVTDSGSARPLETAANPISADPAPPAPISAPPAVRVFGAPAAGANRVQIVDQPTCAVCGKPLKKRHGAKTCSDTCRKRYSRRRDEMHKAYMTAKDAIDAMLKYARHADLRDEVSVYAGALGHKIDAARRLLDDLDAVPAANRDTASVTDSGSARASKRAPGGWRGDRGDASRG